MNGLRAMRSGQPMSKAQKEGLKKTAAIVASVVLIAAIGVAAFTPLGGMAMEIAESYLEKLHSGDTGEASDNSKDQDQDQDQDKQELASFQKGMADWLAKQDIDELIATYKAKTK